MAEVADRARERVDAERLLLVSDQFEELYGTTRRPPGSSSICWPGLGCAARGKQTALVMVLTLRADFLGHTLEHPGLAQALQGRSLLIGRMTRPQLRQAIEGPVAGHVTFEAGLVERILDDVGTEPGNLPLLEFALTLLWEQQVDRLLTHAAYESLGGVDGALARYAEQIYESELAGPERRSPADLVRW